MKLNNIEIAVVTCHDPGTKESLESLYNEIDKDSILLIENICPVSAAFNECINKTKVKWMFQVDSDQRMYAGFAKRIQEDVDKCKDDKVFKIRYSSWDTFEERNLYASCKLFNMEIIRKEGITFQNVIGCDREFMYAFQRRNYKVITHPLDKPIADHCVLELGKGYLYSKYSDRVAKDGKGSINNFYQHWINKTLNENNAIYAAAIIGANNPRKSYFERSRTIEKQDKLRMWIDKATDKEVIEYAKQYIGK